MPHLHAALQDVGRQPENVEVSLRIRLRFGNEPGPKAPLHGTPAQTIATIKQYETLGVQHLILDCIPETMANALESFGRFVREVRPAFV